jgi:hypothetical protein
LRDWYAVVPHSKLEEWKNLLVGSDFNASQADAESAIRTQDTKWESMQENMQLTLLQ